MAFISIMYSFLPIFMFLLTCKGKIGNDEVKESIPDGVKEKSELSHELLSSNGGIPSTNGNRVKGDDGEMGNVLKSDKQHSRVKRKGHSSHGHGHSHSHRSSSSKSSIKSSTKSSSSHSTSSDSSHKGSTSSSKGGKSSSISTSKSSSSSKLSSVNTIHAINPVQIQGFRSSTSKQSSTSVPTSNSTSTNDKPNISLSLDTPTTSLNSTSSLP